MTITAPPTFSDAAGSPDGAVLVLLRRASALIDSMWHSAGSGDGSYPAVHLAEASQGVHRALIALGALERAAGNPSQS